VFFDQYEGQVAPVAFHMWWPSGSDSFYLFNPTDVAARRQYYNPNLLNYVPAFRYDGKAGQDLFGTDPAYPEFFVWLRSAVDSLRAIPSPIRITITSQYASADLDSVYVSFDVVAEDTIIYDVTPDLYLAVSENVHTYGAPTGTHRHPFRDMIPDADGEMITIQKGDSLHFDWVYPISPVYTAGELVTTIWVQNDTDASIPGKQRNKVLQSAAAAVVDVASVAGGGTRPWIWLGQNAPNPFTSGTTIAYAVGRAGKVRLSVYAATGQLVTNLVDGYVEPGTHTATWNGLDRFGRGVGSGMYYYRLETANGSRNGRMVFLK
jgi:hypothetical protein